MTNEEMRVAIAETMGWKDMSFSTSWLTLPNGKKRFLNWSEGESWEDAVPDYPNDLNAMAEVEEWLLVHQPKKLTYYENEIGWMLTDGGPVPDFKLIHASAAVRAECFLRTIGKWKE